MNVRGLTQYINLSLLVTFNESLGAVGSVMLLIFVLLICCWFSFYAVDFRFTQHIIYHQDTSSNNGYNYIYHILSLTFHNVSTSYSNLDDTKRIPFSVHDSQPCHPVAPRPPAVGVLRSRFCAHPVGTPKLRASKNCWWKSEGPLLNCTTRKRSADL